MSLQDTIKIYKEWKETYVPVVTADYIATAIESIEATIQAEAAKGSAQVTVDVPTYLYEVMPAVTWESIQYIGSQPRVVNAFVTELQALGYTVHRWATTTESTLHVSGWDA